MARDIAEMASLRGARHLAKVKGHNLGGKTKGGAIREKEGSEERHRNSLS